MLSSPRLFWYPDLMQYVVPCPDYCGGEALGLAILRDWRANCVWAAMDWPGPSPLGRPATNGAVFV